MSWPHGGEHPRGDFVASFADSCVPPGVFPTFRRSGRVQAVSSRFPWWCRRVIFRDGINELGPGPSYLRTSLAG